MSLADDPTNPSPTPSPEEAAEKTDGVPDYPRPDLEPTSEEEKIERKNPLGYTITEPTEAEIEEGEESQALDS